MANISSYDFQGHTIRIIVNSDEAIWFCRKDVLTALDLKENTKLVQSIDPDGVANSEVIDRLGRKQQVVFINEPNLYRMIFKSTKSEAKEFQNWVFEEVLPAIRKHGTYINKEVEQQLEYKKPWYVEKLLALAQRYTVSEAALKQVISITERAWKQGYAVAMAKIEKENAEKESVESDNKNGVFLPIHVAERLLDAVKWHRKNEQHMLDVIRALRNAAHIALQELPVIELYAERDGVMFDRLYWYLKELDQEQKQLENKA